MEWEMRVISWCWWCWDQQRIAGEDSVTFLIFRTTLNKCETIGAFLDINNLNGSKPACLVSQRSSRQFINISRPVPGGNVYSSSTHRSSYSSIRKRDHSKRRISSGSKAGRWRMGVDLRWFRAGQTRAKQLCQALYSLGDLFHDLKLSRRPYLKQTNRQYCYKHAQME